MNDSASSANEMPADDELQWQAYRFVSGEMSPAEMSAFEQHLERDLEAGDLRRCELVARMTELSHAVMAAESTQPVVRPAAQPVARPAASAGAASEDRAPSRSRKIAILIAGGAVAAALCVAFLAGPRDSQHASVPPKGPGHDPADGGIQATRLVSLWRAADDEEGEDATGDESLVEHESVEHESVDHESVDHEAAAEQEPGVEQEPEARRSRVARSDYSVPVWLLAAVTPEAGDGMPESAVKPAAPMPGPSPESRPQEN